MKEVRFRVKGKSTLVVNDTVLDGWVYFNVDSALGLCKYEIDWSTLSQSTGINSRKGEEIFVGDILEFDNGDVGFVESTEHLGIQIRYVFIDEHARETRSKISKSVPVFRMSKSKIFGNIFEQPGNLLNESN